MDGLPVETTRQLNRGVHFTRAFLGRCVGNVFRPFLEFTSNSPMVPTHGKRQPGLVVGVTPCQV